MPSESMKHMKCSLQGQRLVYWFWATVETWQTVVDGPLPA